MNPKVSIIILNWNGFTDTINCLDSLKKITYPNYNIILVDNGSEGNDVEVLREKYEDYIHIIENGKNLGFAEGNNVGIRYALDKFNPDYILLLNNDTVVDSLFLNELIKAGGSEEDTGLLGPKIYTLGQNNKIQSMGAKIDLWTGRSFSLGRNKPDYLFSSKNNEVDYCSGACLLIKKIVINSIGLLNSEYFLYWEEIDFCFTAKKAGFKIKSIPSSIIWHKESGTASKTSGLKEFYMIRNRFIFMKKHASGLQFITFILWVFLFALWYNLIFLLLIKRDLKVIRQYLRGIIEGLFYKI